MANAPDKPSTADEALVQREFLLSRERDRTFEDEGGKLIYAVDANIVAFLLDPAAYAFPSPPYQRLGYAAVFADDPQVAAELLAGALAEHIGTKLGDGRPLLLLPPIDAWTHNRAHRLIESAIDNPDRAAQDEAEKYLEQLGTAAPAGVSGEEEVSEKGEMAARIARLIYLENGASARLRRLETLLGNPPRLIGPQKASAHRDFPELLRRNLRDLEKHDRLDLGLRRKRWLTAFGAVGRRDEFQDARRGDGIR